MLAEFVPGKDAERICDHLAELRRSDVLEAIRRLDAGEATLFSESTKFDLLHGGRRYPPKRVAGLALSVLAGGQYGPQSFKGGDESACFRALRRCGFTILPKPTENVPDIVETLGRVLELQLQYSSANTPV